MKFQTSSAYSFAICLASSTMVSAAISEIIHPGIHYTSSQVAEFRNNVNSGSQPWKSAFEALLDVADPEYTMRGPGEIIGRGTGNSTIDGWFAAWEEDMEVAEALATAWAVNQDSAYAKKVAEIIDAWAWTLTEIANKDNIAVGWRGRQLVNAAELIFYESGSWPTGEENFRQAQTMVKEVLQPAVYAEARPDADQPAAGGNQGILGHLAALEFSIFSHNLTGVNDELEILNLPHKCENFGGSGIRAMIHAETGQIAETGRDQAHSAMEVGFAEQAAWVAANQGDYDLFDIKANDGTPLLLKGLEYYFKYNLDNDDVPFDTSFGPCCCGKVTYGEPSTQDRGRQQHLGEAGWRYYNGEKGLEMPYTKEWLQKFRPIGSGYVSYSTVTLAEGDL